MTIYHKTRSHTLLRLDLQNKHPILYICHEPIGFCFSLSSFLSIEHLITIWPPPYLCVPSLINLGVDLTYLIHNTRIRLVHLVISITKTKHRPFTLMSPHHHRIEHQCSGDDNNSTAGLSAGPAVMNNATDDYHQWWPTGNEQHQ
jgi:hypothetical protein